MQEQTSLPGEAFHYFPLSLTRNAAHGYLKYWQQLKAAQFYPIPLTTKTLVDWQRLAFFENFVAPFVLRRLCKSNKMKFKDAYIGLVKIKEFIAFEVNVVLIVFLSSTNGGRSEVKRNHEYNFKVVVTCCVKRRARDRSRAVFT